MHSSRNLQTASRRPWLIGLLVAAIMALAASPALAAGINVNTTHDEYGTGTSCSLREAIQSANTDTPYGGCTTGNGPDTIKLAGGQRYVREQTGAADDTNVSGDLDLSSNVTIAVHGRGNATIDAGGLDRVIQILPGASLTAAHLTITGGVVAINQPGNDTSGGGIDNEGTLKLSNSVVSHNDTLINNGCECGGGIAASGDATLNRVRVVSNTVGNIGGGIMWLGGRMNVGFSTIGDNTAGYSGGGFDLDASGTSPSFNLHNSTISGNTQLSTSTNSGGGGIAVADFNDSKMSATNVTIVGNKANTAGGGVYVYNGDFTLNSATITRNVADLSGGANGDGGGLAGSDISARNSIIVKNQDMNPVDPSADCAYDPSIQSSLTGIDTGCSTDSNRRTSTPHLLKLGLNGGPTKTIAITRKSPALNHATKPAPGRDQRGRKRDAHPDIGAYELIPKHHHHHHH